MSWSNRKSLVTLCKMNPPQIHPMAILVDLLGHRMDGTIHKWVLATFLIRTHQAGKEDKGIGKSQNLKLWYAQQLLYLSARFNDLNMKTRLQTITASFLCWSKNSLARIELCNYYLRVVFACVWKRALMQNSSNEIKLYYFQWTLFWGG